MHARWTIKRYVADGLSPRAEARLRRHLSGCERCRQCYERELLLFRALAGDIGTPTAAEREREVRRAILAAGGSEQRTGPVAWLHEPALRALAPIAATAAVAILIGTLLAASALRAKPVAHVVAAKDLKIAAATAAQGRTVLASEAIEVGRAGAAQLELTRGGTLKLFPGARATFENAGDRLTLDAGKVWLEIVPGRGPFAVRTDRGEARVLGTSFVVERQRSGAMEVRVLSGAVEVEDANHRGTVLVRDGHKTTLAAGAPPSPPARYEDRDRDEWSGLLGLLREIGRSIGRGVESGLEWLKGLAR